jgi:hypothetical protein
MKTFSFILIIGISIFCNKQNRAFRHVLEQNNNQISCTLGIIKYVYDDTFFKQIVEIKYLSETEIDFKINTEDKKRGDSSIIKGIAKKKIDVGPEIDTNEEGEDYYSIQYIYTKGECLLLIRIEEEKQYLLKLNNFRCRNLPGQRDGLFTLGVLLKRIK